GAERMVLSPGRRTPLWQALPQTPPAARPLAPASGAAWAGPSRDNRRDRLPPRPRRRLLRRRQRGTEGQLDTVEPAAPPAEASDGPRAVTASALAALERIALALPGGMTNRIARLPAIEDPGGPHCCRAFSARHLWHPSDRGAPRDPFAP